MSTTTTYDKWVIHRNGHLKRIDTKDYDNGMYAYQLINGVLTMNPINTNATTDMYHYADGTTMSTSSGPFLPVVSNTGFVQWTLPDKSDAIYGFYLSGDKYVSQPLNGSNVSLALYGMMPETDRVGLYYWNGPGSQWQVINEFPGITDIGDSGDFWIRNLGNAHLTAVPANQDTLYEKLFKDKDGNTISSSTPYIPIVSNDGFVQLPVSTETGSAFAYYRDANGNYKSAPISGSNVAVTLYGLQPESDSSEIYYWNGIHSRWESIYEIPNGDVFLRYTSISGDLQAVSLNQDTLYDILFKDKDGKTISSSTPYIPVVSNDGFVQLTVPTSTGGYYGYSLRDDGTYESKPLTGSNITDMLGVTPTNKPQLYAYNGATSKWTAINPSMGSFFMYNNGITINPIEFTGQNIYTYAYGGTKTDNTIIQYNKGNINKINVPSTSGYYYLSVDSSGNVSIESFDGKSVFNSAFGIDKKDNTIIQYNNGSIKKIVVPTSAGNYNLNVDANGNVSFSQGEISERLATTYTLSVSGTTPKFTAGTDFVIKGNGTGNVVFNTTLNLKKTKYYVDAKFWFRVDDSSIFDDTTTLTTFTFKIGSGTTNIIGKQLLYHPENGMLELRFSGISAAVSSNQPDFYITTTGAFADLNVTLPVADVTYVGELTFIEV